MLTFASAAPVFGQAAPVNPQPVPSSTRSAPGSGAWAPGPAANGDLNAIGGVIDMPSAGASVAAGNLQIAGWFVDLTAQGWAGVDDVEIFIGTIDGGGRPLAHAQFQQSRPDVAAGLNNPFWAASGWSATVSLVGLPTGPNTLSVYAHTPGRGWWVRQVSVTVQLPQTPPPTPTPVSGGTRRATPTPTTQTVPPPTPIPTRTPSPFGNDISYPQCPSGAEPPPPAFAIVGVNGGKPFSANPCLPREFVWALTSTSASQPHVGFYLNTANPGPTASTAWPTAGTVSPRPCDGSWSADCAYDYGWVATQDSFNRAIGVAGRSLAVQSPWWLDVETANSWSEDLATNAAAVDGAIAFLRSVNVASVGVYSTLTDWEIIAGPPPAGGSFTELPNWRPGASNAQEAPGWCQRTVTGGRVKYVQFPSNGFDTNFACY
jgi:hypothetical protein